MVVRPTRGENGADALADHHHILRREPVLVRDMVDESLNVAQGRADAWAVSARAGRQPVAAHVPCEKREVGQVELVHEMTQAPGMLVPPMQENDGALRRVGERRPEPVVQLLTVVGRERLHVGGS